MYHTRDLIEPTCYIVYSVSDARPLEYTTITVKIHVSYALHTPGILQWIRV